MAEGNSKQIELRSSLVLICEGPADANFFTKLIQQREIGTIDVVPAKGIDNLEATLRGVRANAASFAGLRGVLVAVDSGSDPDKTFRKVVKYIRRAEFKPIPTAPLTLTKGVPRLGVILIPGPTEAGSLESLCVRARVGNRRWLNECLDRFLSCGQITAHQWPAEKLAKARFGAVVAATFRHDPSKALTYAFFANKKKREPAVLSIRAKPFRQVEKWLRNLVNEALG
jgi:hypothetical protein